MALKNTTDPQVAAKALQAFLGTKLEGASDVAVDDVTIPSSAGMSTETILFDASWRDADGAERSEGFVARVTPPGEGVFPSYDLDTEFRVLRALGEASVVPVPKAWWVEDDPATFGSPFLVMSRVDGKVPADDPPFTAAGWVLDLAPERRGELIDNALRVLVVLHALDWRAAGLGFLQPEGDARSAFGRELDSWRELFEWGRAGDRNPTVEAGFAWLDEHRPADEGETVLTWGDARPGNILYGDDLSVRAVLDWEMVGLGNRETELGWFLFLLRHHTEGIGVPTPEGIPDRDAIVARYEELSGHRVANIDYYETFAAVRLAALMHRAGNLMIEVGLLPPDAPMKLTNPANQLLAKLLGVDAPTGEAQGFIGNRG